MKALILRPLAIFTVTYFVISSILFTADTRQRQLSAVLFFVLLLLAVAIRTILPSLRKRSLKSEAVKALAFLLAGGALASFVSYLSLDVRLSKYDALYENTVTVEGTVTEVVWDGGYSGIYIVDVSRAGELSDFSCVMTADGGIEENKAIKAEAIFSPLTDDSQFDERRYYLSKKVVAKAEAESIFITGEADFSIKALAGEVNSSLSQTLSDYLGDSGGAFASALLLGNKEGLSDTVERDFTRLGISHVLAISGMHLTIICAFVSVLLSPFGKRASQAGSVVTVVFYMFITGLSASVTRSGIMLLFLIAASLIGKGGDRFTNLGLSVFLICIIDPFSAADIGLQLSFSAVMAILLYTEKRRELVPEKTDIKKAGPVLNIIRSLVRSFLEGMLLTVIVVLFMLPLEWLYFGEISVISPLASPVFSMLCTILLWALPVLLILSPAPTFATIFAYPLEKLISFICNLANDLSLLRGITVPLNFPFAPVFCLLIFAAVTAFCVTKKKKRFFASAATVVIVAAFALSSFLYCQKDRDRAVLSMLTYKSNDGIFLVSDNKAMIIDMGNGYSGILKEGLGALEDAQTTEIEVLMLTHLHNSYPSTLDSFFSDNMVRTLLIPKEEGYSYTAIEETARKHKVNLSYYSYGDAIEFQDVTVSTLENFYINRSTQPLIRLDIEAFGDNFTYLGGAYLESFPETDTNCDFIMFGNHGPLYKAEFSPSFKDDCRVFAADSAMLYLNCSLTVEKPDTIILEK